MLMLAVERHHPGWHVVRVNFIAPERPLRRVVPSLERNENARTTKGLSKTCSKALFGITRFCRQRVPEVPLAEYLLAWKRPKRCPRPRDTSRCHRNKGRRRIQWVAAREETLF
jgi:hypothetical protein